MKRYIFLLSTISVFLLTGCSSEMQSSEIISDTVQQTEESNISTEIVSQTSDSVSDEKFTTEPIAIEISSSFDLETGVVMLNSGYEMPILGIGCFQLSNEQAENSVYWALSDGYRLIDTARIYGNEEGVGRGIQRAIDEGMKRRDCHAEIQNE